MPQDVLGALVGYDDAEVATKRTKETKCKKLFSSLFLFPII